MCIQPPKFSGQNSTLSTKKQKRQIMLDLSFSMTLFMLDLSLVIISNFDLKILEVVETYLVNT